MEDNKTYFTPGMKVQIRQLDNSPTMIVLRKKEVTFKDGDDKSKTLQGIVCRWFTEGGFVQEAVWNTKDLVAVN